MSTPLAIFSDRLLITEFLDAHCVWKEEGGEELLSLLRFTARRVGLDAALLPYWVEADHKLKRRWMSARAWYLAEHMQRGSDHADEYTHAARDRGLQKDACARTRSLH